MSVGLILALTYHILFNTFSRTDHYPIIQIIIDVIKVFLFGREESVENKYQLSFVAESSVWIIPLSLQLINVIFNDDENLLINGWCQESTDAFYFVDFSVPLLIILLCVFVSFYYVLRQVYKSPSLDMRRVFWKSMGLYILITLACFTPKCIIMFTTDPNEVSEYDDLIRAEWFFLFLYIAGLLYSIVFIGESANLRAFESFFKSNDDVNYNKDENFDSFCEYSRNSDLYISNSDKNILSIQLSSHVSKNKDLVINRI
jgi:hypothetical protein